MTSPLSFSSVLRLLVCVGLCGALLTGQALAQPDTNRVPTAAQVQAAQKAALTQIDAETADDPQQAITRLRQFLLPFPQMHYSLGIGVYARLGRIYAEQLKDVDQAVAVLDEGLEKYARFPHAGALLRQQVNLLVATQRPQDAAAAMRRYDPGFLGMGAAGVAAQWREYVRVLAAAGQSDQVSSELQRLLPLVPVLLDNEGIAWVYQRLIDDAVAAGRMDEALGWAKLQFVESRFETEAIARATATLGEVWALSDPQAHQAFLAAQADPSLPNPLRNVALPAVADAALLQAQASGNIGRVRISLLLLLDTRSARRQAMVEAVRLMRAQPTSPAGVQEVCRVFKAQDLDLSRANAYLALVKSGQGENPLLTFFDEAAPAAAPAPVAE